MNDLVLFALDSEAPNLFNYQNVLSVGVGKVNSAIMTMHYIRVFKPRRIINLGTAGGVSLHSGIHRVNTIIQHDVNLRPLGLEPGIHLLDDMSILKLSGEGITCASGDFFVADKEKLRVPCDVVEMEAYSIAKAAMVSGVEIEVWKYVSDVADESAGKVWQDSVSAGEEHYVRVLEELGVELVKGD